MKKGTLRGWTSLKTKTAEDRIDAFRYIVEHGPCYIDGEMIDACTANLVCSIYDQINEANREKFTSLSVNAMGHIAWRLGAKTDVKFG